MVFLVFLSCYTNCHPERSEGSRVHPLYVFEILPPFGCLNDNMVEVLLSLTHPLPPLKRGDITCHTNCHPEERSDEGSEERWYVYSDYVFRFFLPTVV